MSFVPEEYAQDKLYLSDLTELRDGRTRLQSLFSISILYGIMSVLFGMFLIYAIKYCKIIKLKNRYFYFLIFMSLFACYLCNSKTAMVALPVFIIPLLLKNKLLLAFDIIAVLIVSLTPETLIEFLGNFIDLSAFDANNDQVSGSSLYLRLLQLDESLKLWAQAPILGNGLRSAGYFVEKGYQIFGTESVWFRLMIEQGLLGIVSYLFMIISFIRESKKNKRISLPLLFFTLGFFLICSITDINYSMYFMCFIVLDRWHSIRQQKLIIRK